MGNSVGTGKRVGTGKAIVANGGIETDEKSRLRQYWLRVLLVVGLLWGTMPPITIAFVIMGWDGPRFVLVALIFNAATVFAACVLAFWHRRTACVWLSVNAVLAAAALVISIRQPNLLDMPDMVALAGPVIVACLLDFMEIKGWPGALARLG
ncbi:MAG TPA: hypothetical protein VHX20_17700 [Terracidiphilus sp.]|jgi:hypothetical protein|nr:hypothetical protein [Terracidiphilus sp.]